MEIVSAANRWAARNTTRALVRAAVIALCATAVSGCSHVKRTYLADGQPGYYIRCGGAGWADCLIRAGRLCGSLGYTTTYTDELDRQMLVACNRGTPH